MANIAGEPITQCLSLVDAETQEPYPFDDVVVSVQNQIGEEVKQYTLSNGGLQLVDGSVVFFLPGEHTKKMAGKHYFEYAVDINNTRIIFDKKYELYIKRSGIK